MKRVPVMISLLLASHSLAADWSVLDPLDHAGLDIFGYDLVTGGQGSVVYAGAVGSNSRIELAPSAVFHSDLVSGGSIAPQNAWSWGQSVYGGLYSAALTSPVAWGASGAPQSYALVNWTPRAKTFYGNPGYGTQDVAVPDFQTLTLQPGKYGVVTMGAGSKLRLLPGLYTLRAFSTAPVLDGASSNVGSEIIFGGNSGDIQVDVFEKLYFAGGTKSSFEGEVLPSRVHWNTWQTSQLDIVSDAAYFYGNVNAPQATARLSNGTVMVGSLRAKSVDLGYSTKVCAPPGLAALWHTGGALGPAFDPSYNSYKSVMSPAVLADTLHALAATAGVAVSYPDGQAVSPAGTYRVRLSDPVRESFLPGCGVSEYTLDLSTGADYALRVKGDDWSCPAGIICDGSSWDRALPGLSSAYNHISAGKEFWLADGNYTTSGLRMNNMSLRGGFDGTETGPDARRGHPYATVIRGSTAARHLVTGRNLASLESVRLTGVNSQAVGGAVQMGLGRFYMEQSVIDGIQGSAAGVAYYGHPGSEAVMKRNYISKNALLTGDASLIGLGAGAAFYGENLALTENSLAGGAVVSATGANASLVHNTVIANSGSGSVFAGGNIDLTNTIVWQPGLTMASGGALVGASHSLGHSALAGSVNLSEDPQLASTNSYGEDGVPFTADDGLMPAEGSAVVAKGMDQGAGGDLLTVARKNQADGSGDPDIGAREIVSVSGDIKFGYLYDNGYFRDYEKLNILQNIDADNAEMLSRSKSLNVIKINVSDNKYLKSKGDIKANIIIQNLDGSECSRLNNVLFYRGNVEKSKVEYSTMQISNNKRTGFGYYFVNQKSNEIPNELLVCSPEFKIVFEVPHAQF